MNRLLAIATNLFPVWVLVGGALALAHFTQMPLAALPCAISATFHSVIGSILAGHWRLRSVKSAQNSPACEGGATPLV